MVAFWALLLAVAWVPLTSHELLESAGWIHHGSAAGDDDPAHDAADGICRLHESGIRLASPSLISPEWQVDGDETFAIALFLAVMVAWYLRRDTGPPPGWLRPWQFVVRAALPGRAPCFAD